MGKPMLISPNYHVGDWTNLKLEGKDQREEDWCKAVKILKDRLEGRFLKPAQALIDAEAGHEKGTFGFAILALDFLVIETIQGFREGLTDHQGQSSRLFTNFLAGWAEFLACVPDVSKRKEKANDLYRNGRCALHHSGQTDNLRVGRSGAMIEFCGDGSIAVNRTEFHAGLSREFDRYLKKLKSGGSRRLRTNFKKKMDAIC